MLSRFDQFKRLGPLSLNGNIKLNRSCAHSDTLPVITCMSNGRKNMVYIIPYEKKRRLQKAERIHDRKK